MIITKTTQATEEVRRMRKRRRRRRRLGDNKVCSRQWTSQPGRCHAIATLFSRALSRAVPYSTRPLPAFPDQLETMSILGEKKATMCDCALPPSRERDRSISVIWWRSSSCTVPTMMISRRCRWSPTEADGRRYFHLTLVISRAHEVNSAR